MRRLCGVQFDPTAIAAFNRLDPYGLAETTIAPNLRAISERA
jgi:hypothetical protein